MHEPEILFLDEPTSGVDPAGRRSFWELIYGLAAGGVTVFVTTHYMDEAEYCDRLGLIHSGRLVALGTPRELRELPLRDLRGGAARSLEDVFVHLVTGQGVARVKLKRLLALSWKELLHVIRDPRSLAVALAIPILMLLLFGWALSMDVRNVRLAVWDQGWTPQSRALVYSLAHSRSFDVVFRTQGYQALEQLLLKRQVAAVLVLRDSGGGTAMQLLLDGTDAYTAAIASGYADAVVRLSSSGAARPCEWKAGSSSTRPCARRTP